ncbi:MAG: TlpA family protein disulfide reductase [Gammaproteobacteria bacterium]|nr:TlpA family protein disulfide reductase [Gammaproteobacteria bacterium]
MRTRLLILVPVCIAAGFLAGRLFWEPPLDAQPPAARPALDPLASVPDLRLPDLASGTPRSLREWSGEALILNFWATWCAPCRKEMPLLEQVHQQWQGRGIAVVGVAIDRIEPAQAFTGEAGISYPNLVGEQEAMALAESFEPGMAGLPLTVIVAPGGEVLHRHVGELHAGDLDRIVAILDELATGRITAAQARQRLESV